MRDRVVAAPDSEAFPLGAEDYDLAGRHRVTLAAFPGHSASDFADRAGDASASLVWGGAYGAEIIDAMPQLKVLARCGVGFDNIDLDVARRRGLEVTYCPGFLDDPVAEHTVAMIFDLTRKTSAGDRAIRRGEWPTLAESGSFRQVAGSVLGLVGFGRIGRRVHALIRGLEMHTIVFDPYLHETDAEDVEVVSSLDELLARADIVSLHAPLTDQTRSLIGSDELAKVQSHAVLINTARGALIDTNALVTALEAGSLAGAGLDVLDVEPLPPAHPLRQSENVVFTPHSAAYSSAAIAAMRHQALRDAIAVLDGERPRYPVPARPRGA